MRCRELFVLVVVLVCFCVCDLFAGMDQIFNDGLVHNIVTHINYGNVLMYDSSSGGATTINLRSKGGIENDVYMYGNSILNVRDGYINHDLYAYGNSKIWLKTGYIGELWTPDKYVRLYDNSELLMTGGRIDYCLYTYDNSRVSITDGINWDVRTYDYSKMNISGGEIDAVFAARDYSDVTITGGFFKNLAGLDDSSVTMSGGDIEGIIRVCNDSTITFFGQDFTLNGKSVGYGEYHASEFLKDGRITGKLLNGDQLDNELMMLHSGKIILAVPEPCSVLLFGLGAVGLWRRSR